MEHITRFFGILGLILSLSAQAQFSAPTLLGTTDTVYIDLDTLGAAGVVAVYWDVLNDTEETLDLMVTRTLVDTVSPFNYPFETDENGVPLEGSMSAFAGSNRASTERMPLLPFPGSCDPRARRHHRHLRE